MGQWVYITMGLSLLLSIAAFVGGLAPVGVGLLIIAIGLVIAQSRAGAPSAARAKRAEERDPRDPLPPAHEGQAHMTPDDLPSPRS